MKFDIDTSQLDGEEIVFFEVLYTKDENGKDVVVATHMDLEDPRQTIIVKGENLPPRQNENKPNNPNTPNKPDPNKPNDPSNPNTPDGGGKDGRGDGPKIYPDKPTPIYPQTGVERNVMRDVMMSLGMLLGSILSLFVVFKRYDSYKMALYLNSLPQAPRKKVYN